MVEGLDRYRGKITFFLLVLLAAGAAFWWAQHPQPREITITTPTPRSGPSQRLLTVDVAGAVARPGVYSLPEGSRVADAIGAAGGEAADADLNRVNRAARLRDEQQVFVPSLKPTQTFVSVATDAAPSRVNINAASASDLDKLPGIGTVIAQRIIAYREQFGAFARIEQLVEAKLVNGSTFEKIKDSIAVQ